MRGPRFHYPDMTWIMVAMARIRTFTKASSISTPHPTETDAHWALVQDETSRLLQVSTFGSDSRASHPKVSQTLQFDRDSAALLKHAIDTVFPDL